MNKLVTDTLQDNIQASLNLFYIKDGWTWVRGGGPGPKYEDVSLCDYVRGMIKAHIHDTEIPGNDDDLDMMMAEWVMDGPESIEGLIATVYEAGWAFSELRHRLKGYEDIALEPEMAQKLTQETLKLEEQGGFDLFLKWVQAEREGRLIVLPCPMGTKLWRVVHAKGSSFASERFYIKPITLDVNNVLRIVERKEYGKTVFPSRKEAERAMAEQVEARMKEREEDE